MVQIYFDRGVIENILVSSAEVYPLEVLGLVFGNYVGDEFNCMVGYPIQLASRKENEVFCSRKTIKKIDKAITRIQMVGVNLLGCYHSHPQGGMKLSETDLENTRNLGLPIEILVSITENHSGRCYFKVESNYLDIAISNLRYQIKPFNVSKQVREFDKIISPFIEVNNLLQTYFGINSFDILKLKSVDREAIQYSFDKLFFEVKRMHKKSDINYSRNKTDYHINRIKKILEKYSF